MKKRMLVLASALLVLVLGVGTVLAGGAKNGTTVYFDTLLYGTADTYVYCEGYFMTTGNGIVHEWRNNSTCVPYPPQFIPSPSLHLVFKPADKFDSPDCDDEGILYWSGLWSLDPIEYVDADAENEFDDKNLADVLGEAGEDYWQVCIYEWDSSD